MLVGWIRETDVCTFNRRKMLLGNEEWLSIMFVYHLLDFIAIE
jgi:hypothetical protein